MVLSDFGFATTRAEFEASQSGEITGSIPYMAPEQAAGARSTPAADMYAVGVILFEVLTGHRPFVGNAMKVLADKARHDARPVRALAPEAPADLADLADSLLRRDPEDRPSADEARLVLANDRDNDELPELDRTVMMSPVATFVGRGRELARLRTAAANGRF